MFKISLADPYQNLIVINNIEFSGINDLLSNQSHDIQCSKLICNIANFLTKLVSLQNVCFKTNNMSIKSSYVALT